MACARGLRWKPHSSSCNGPVGFIVKGSLGWLDATLCVTVSCLQSSGFRAVPKAPTWHVGSPNGTFTLQRKAQLQISPCGFTKPPRKRAPQKAHTGTRKTRRLPFETRPKRATPPQAHGPLRKKNKKRPAGLHSSCSGRHRRATAKVHRKNAEQSLRWSEVRSGRALFECAMVRGVVVFGDLEVCTWSLHDPKKMGSLPQINGVMDPFLIRVMESLAPKGPGPLIPNRLFQGNVECAMLKPRRLEVRVWCGTGLGRRLSLAKSIPHHLRKLDSIPAVNSNQWFPIMASVCGAKWIASGWLHPFQGRPR